MFNKLKQFKDIRSQAKQLQDALSKESAQGISGPVTIIMNGNQEVTEVSIEESAMGAENRSKLEDSIKEATNKAVKNVQKVMASKMKEMGDFDFSKMLGGNQ